MLKCGLIGAGIARSLTPALQEAEAAAQGVALSYRLIDLDTEGRRPEDLPALLDRARADGYAGLNITFPCKQTVTPLLDGLSDDARAIGAVNTVMFRDGRSWGHNTDCSGWYWGFQRSLPNAPLDCVVLLGTGGAGAAIAHALMNAGVGELRLVDSDLQRAQALAKRLNQLHRGARAVAYGDAATALQGAVGLVHATPTGMDKLPGLPLPASLLHAALWVSEVVYFPLDTALLQAARARGCRVSDGGHMAVGQAVGAFELFTGRKADAARMDAHFRQQVKERT
jgi:shikimate dehydrogenase